MAAENESGAPNSAAAAPAPAPGAGRGGRGRGGRGGRGRGRGGARGGGAGGSSSSAAAAANAAGISKPAASGRGGRGGTRRGRAKTFPESRVQAAYERQRDLKSLYQSVAAVLKPALQELADRSIEEIMSDPDAYKRASQYVPLVSELDERLRARLDQVSARTDLEQQLAEETYQAEQHIITQTFEVSIYPVSARIATLSHI